eukprot:CAMPEP_0178934900 /NCGR_PEP_ID=MMETSP0786-20121207/24177_1 /TAXON_ID=186022 /ORGANISM="Thalassionema frauenfeldii, Strain CCMP 1798" /LENGTH=231 /DNA_ID=CAMNT_0020612849 /DNA_START=432 /DNA_END=1127 /DNA_ORIENTATION=-
MPRWRQTRHGYGFALRHALQNNIQTPYVMVIQHDRTFMRPCPITETVQAMYNSNDNIKYVGDDDDDSERRYGPNISTDTMELYDGTDKLRQNIEALRQNYQSSYQYSSFQEWQQQQQQPTVPTVPQQKVVQLSLIPTFFWYDNIHVCCTSHYRDFIFNPTYKMVARGGFVEDKLSPVIKRNVERLGSLQRAHARFGCYLLDDHSGLFFTGHLDGGSYLTRDEKLKMGQTGK